MPDFLFYASVLLRILVWYSPLVCFCLSICLFFSTFKQIFKIHFICYILEFSERVNVNCPLYLETRDPCWFSNLSHTMYGPQGIESLLLRWYQDFVFHQNDHPESKVSLWTPSNASGWLLRSSNQGKGLPRISCMWQSTKGTLNEFQQLKWTLKLQRLNLYSVLMPRIINQVSLLLLLQCSTRVRTCKLLPFLVEYGFFQ